MVDEIFMHMIPSDALCSRDNDKRCESPQLTELLRGGEYKFKNQPERLKYIGKDRGWHQFEKIGKPGVWCELLDSDLHMIEETKAIQELI